MSKRPVCRACLVDNLTMYRVTNSPYEEVYEKLSNAKLGKGNLPETFCFMCLATLRKFQKFAALTQESNVMLEQWYKNEIDCKPKKSPQFKISTTTVEYITSKILEPEHAKEVKVKVEPDEAEEVNQVQFIEFANESDPYGQLEETTDVNMDDSFVKEDDSWSDADQKPVAASDEESAPVVKQEPKKRAEKAEKTSKGTPAVRKPNTREVTLSRHKKGGIAEKKKYSCDYCDHKSYVESLKNHLRKVHGDKKPIICDLCDYQALNKSLLESHVTRFHVGGDDFVCYICEYASSCKSDFMEHQRIHIGVKAFSCRLCGLKFTGKISLRTHLDTAHKADDKSISSLIMNKDVNSLIERIIPDKYPYSCERCDYKCGFKFEFEYHLFIHDEKWPFSCTMCDYETSLKERVHDHLMAHYDEKQFMCKLCGFKSLYKNNLDLHVRGTHLGEKPFSCDECDYKCLEKSNLKRHYLSRHSRKEKPFLCHMCDRKFAIKESLAIHLKVHRGERKFTCSICGYKAQRRGTLVTHLRTHTGEKPYACHVCERSFAQKSALNTHVKRHSNMA